MSQHPADEPGAPQPHTPSPPVYGTPPTPAHQPHPEASQQYPAAPQAYPQGQGYRPAAPLLNPSEQRTWAIFGHIGPFAIGIFAPLIIFLIYKDRGPFLRRHAVEALNFQISLMIYAVVGTVLTVIVSLLTLGIGAVVAVPLLIIALLAAYVFMIIAAVAAGRGQEYRYPLCLRLVH